MPCLPFLIHILHRLNTDSRGSIAVIFGLAIIPVLAAAGLALDYVRVVNARDALQYKADSAALSVVASDGKMTASDGVAFTLDQMPPPANGLTHVSVSGKWLTATDYEVIASGAVKTSILAILPMVGEEIGFSIRTVARLAKTAAVYKNPQTATLDPEAGDYNRIYVYCFDAINSSSPSKGRSQMTAIADNGGTTYDFKMPACKPGEELSYMLHNVTDARTKPAQWDGPAKLNTYYTDTRIIEGTEHYDLDGWNILETVLCPSLAKCKPTNQGGVIPYGKNRTPQRATEACEPGKFMYFGWEDRPPPKPNGEARGASDRDYDDIRVIIECPVILENAKKTVLLVR